MLSITCLVLSLSLHLSYYLFLWIINISSIITICTNCNLFYILYRSSKYLVSHTSPSPTWRLPVSSFFLILFPPFHLLSYLFYFKITHLFPNCSLASIPAVSFSLHCNYNFILLPFTVMALSCHPYIANSHIPLLHWQPLLASPTSTLALHFWFYSILLCSLYEL